MITLSISPSPQFGPWDAWFGLVCILVSGCICRVLLPLSSAGRGGRETFAGFVPWRER